MQTVTNFEGFKSLTAAAERLRGLIAETEDTGLLQTRERAHLRLLEVMEEGCRYSGADFDAWSSAMSAINGVVDVRFNPEFEWRDGCYRKRAA